LLLIAAFAIYAILVKRVYITRSFVLTGANARRFGISLLMLLLPMVIVINIVLLNVLPASVLANPIASRIVGVTILGLLAFGLAALFRDRQVGETP